ncbi:hypothetical protein HBI56_033500 [Parastagonospora nodorum]|nr:hypothetical protein HBI10_013120 [Parastagonospora nodorum]KAH4011432.1 hypothetical protein HBI13_197470 [Parastagonospora nodorum]KAH4034646.1 hypothetical protein HBI09_101530 [Parastagonospora nodorum]KAH4343434.1 hypothetical protein HBH98_149810 [Parastagonospora nodorum]KAH4368178.1 hypothetical protein HBH97_155060 [Parastagonospora nodorum]
MQGLLHNVSAGPAACCDRYCDMCKASVMLRLATNKLSNSFSSFIPTLGRGASSFSSPRKSD